MPINSEERIRNAVKKLAAKRGQATQGRMDSFFKPVAKDPNASPPKRKAEDSKGGAAKKGKGPAGKPTKAAKPAAKGKGKK